MWQDYQPAFQQALAFVERWQNQWTPFTPESIHQVDPSVLDKAFEDFSNRLKGHFPFFHPLYAGHMVKQPHPVAILGYFTTMFLNPNNHAYDGAPVTSDMEKEVIETLGQFLGFEKPLGHLTGGGTMANLEALWVARETHPGKAIAHSASAHYTHERMCRVLNTPTVKIPIDYFGRMDVAALESACQMEAIGTVVVTLGSTSVGAVDPLPEIIELQKQYGFRIHVDAAYGGFYRSLCNVDPNFKAYQYTGQVDSLVIDPHKHGLQPYGAGAILFKDHTVTRYYHHDSPYTYFDSSERHLGEISLECSRPGAVAAAFWLTLQCIPLEVLKPDQPATGYGAIAQCCRKAALDFSERIKASQVLALYHRPDTDIVAYYPMAGSLSEITRLSETLMEALSHPKDGEPPVYVVQLKVSAENFAAHYPKAFPPVSRDAEMVTLLRSCIMKPEHGTATEALVSRIEALAIENDPGILQFAQKGLEALPTA